MEGNKCGLTITTQGVVVSSVNQVANNQQGLIYNMATLTKFTTYSLLQIMMFH